MNMDESTNQLCTIEVTDTFGGEANYSWVRRYTIQQESKSLTDRQVIREAKKLAGWTGIRCNKSDFGDMIELRPAGMCQVMFINF